MNAIASSYLSKVGLAGSSATTAVGSGAPRRTYKVDDSLASGGGKVSGGVAPANLSSKPQKYLTTYSGLSQVQAQSQQYGNGRDG